MSVEQRAQAIERLALSYHKEQEGDYGCPGVECPGVKRLAIFGRACADEANAYLLAELGRVREERDSARGVSAEHPSTIYERVDHDDVARGLGAELIPDWQTRAESAESSLRTLQEQIGKLEQEMRSALKEPARPNRIGAYMSGCIEDWADQLTALLGRNK